ncbi:MAG: VTT domain-containing protein [Patescibacteria group bacterium]|nr:VTT domain-containing protein [Patescibacteria group bacterium]
MFDLDSLLRTVGYAGIFAIVFAESGLLVGFFLPGDSLLFTAGFLASQGFFDIFILCIITFVAAVVGDNVGYLFGRRAGPKVFKKEDSLVFSKSNIDKSTAFYEKHGGKTIVLARFIPVVRTFAPVIAGVGKMDYKKFLLFNVLGGLIWAVGVTALGYFLGNIIPDVDKYLLPIAALIILVSIAPALWHLLKDQEKRAEYLKRIKQSASKIKSSTGRRSSK